VPTLQAVFYIVALVLLIVASFRPKIPVSLALLGAASALLAYSLPAIFGPH
jgi:hypothetical protein